jgi:hypothetical protein
MTGDEAPSHEARAMVEQGTSALADVLRQLEPVTGPVLVTRFHSPPQDCCDDLMCPCGLPPEGAAPITVTDPGYPEQGIAGWTDGHTSALITWRGWDGPARPEDPGLIETWTRTTTDERDVLMALASFGHHENVEVVGAWLLDGPAQAGAAG